MYVYMDLDKGQYLIAGTTISKDDDHVIVIISAFLKKRAHLNACLYRQYMVLID